MDVIWTWLISDWPNFILAAGALVLAAWVLVSTIFPIFGGPWVSEGEYVGVQSQFGSYIVVFFGLLYGAAWVLRGMFALVRWAVCPC